MADFIDSEAEESEVMCTLQQFNMPHCYCVMFLLGRGRIRAPWAQETQKGQGNGRQFRGRRGYVYTDLPNAVVATHIAIVDDEERLREELKDLIDDNPIEESEGEDSDGSGGEKRKKSDEEYDDRLEDEDYDLIEENLGVKVERRVGRFAVKIFSCL